jgi:hypothetical protein
MPDNPFRYDSVSVLSFLDSLRDPEEIPDGQRHYLEATDKHMLIPVIPPMKSWIPYIELTPLSGSVLPSATAAFRTQKPDALLLGVYDSGLVSDEAIPFIKELSEYGVPVFGVRQTRFLTPSVSFSLTSDQLEALHRIQPEAVAAGLTPLLAYLPEVYKIADAIHAFSAAYGVANLMVTESKIPKLGGSFGDVMQHHVFTGLDAICQQYSGYAERVAAAKERFNPPAFNMRIERCR